MSVLAGDQEVGWAGRDGDEGREASNTVPWWWDQVPSLLHVSLNVDARVQEGDVWHEESRM